MTGTRHLLDDSRAAEPATRWIECPRCCGEGEIAECPHEFVCLTPTRDCDECLVTCALCSGACGWEVDE